MKLVRTKIRHYLALLVFASVYSSIATANSCLESVNPASPMPLNETLNNKHRDLPPNREVVGTVTLYNGNHNGSTAFGPAYSLNDLLPVEQFLKNNQIDIDLRNSNGLRNYIYEIKLAAKNPQLTEKNVFRDLLALIGVSFTENLNFYPSSSILDGNIFYARTISTKLADFYIKNFGFETVYLSEKEQEKIPNNTLLRITLRQLLKNSNINYQVVKSTTFGVQDVVITDTQKNPINRQAHFFNASDSTWGLDNKSGHYSSTLTKAQKVVEAAYSDPKNGLQYAKSAIKALAEEFKLTEASRKEIIVITRKKEIHQ